MHRNLTILAAVFWGSTTFVGAQVAGVPNFEKVNEQVYRGGQPTGEGFKYLASVGVRTVIDLRQSGEQQEESLVKAAGMTYVSVPLKGMSAPPAAEVAKILTLLNDPAAGPVFVHCRRGADRTGTILACYRISHDHWENRDALREARKMGMSSLELAMQHYVLQYTVPAVDRAASQ